jgi:hypothetical protein
MTEEGSDNISCNMLALVVIVAVVLILSYFSSNYGYYGMVGEVA